VKLAAGLAEGRDWLDSQRTRGGEKIKTVRRDRLFRICQLPIDKLEELGEASLNLRSAADLKDWLSAR